MFSRFARFLQGLLAAPATRADLARATRASIGFFGPLFLAQVFHLSGYFVYAAIAAQNVAFFEIRGDYRLRLSVLGVSVLVLTVYAAIGAATGAHLYLALITAAVCSIGMGLWRHLNSDYGPSLAVSSMLLFLIAAGTDTFVWENVSQTALWTLGGGLWGLAVQVGLWPVHPEHPIRRTVADCWTAAADLFEALADKTGELSEQHARIADKEANLRTTLDKTYAALSAGRTNRSAKLVDRLNALTEQAARISFHVTSMTTALEAAAREPVLSRLEPAFQPIMTSLRNLAQTVALAVVSRQPSHVALGEVRLRRLTNLLRGFESRALAHTTSSAGTHLAELSISIREALAALTPDLRAGVDRAAERSAFSLELLDLETWRLRSLAATFNFRRRPEAALIRFTARITVLMLVGLIVFKLGNLSHGYWLPLTVLVVLQPDYGSTRKRAAQRLGGTLLGSLLATGVLWLHLPHDVIFTLLAIALFLFGFFVKRNYGVAVIFVTLYVVLLTELSQPVSPRFTLERLGSTLAGGILALVSALLFWPVWERRQFPAILASALKANREYWDLVAARLKEGRAFDAKAVEAKRRAESANAAVFSSLQRMGGDPKNQQEGLEEAAALANGNQRLTRAFGALGLQLRAGDTLPSPAEFERFSSFVRNILDTLAAAASGPGVGSEHLDALTAELDACDVLFSKLLAEVGELSIRAGRLSRQLAPVSTELSGMLFAAKACLENGMFGANAGAESTLMDALKSPVRPQSA